MEKTIFGLIVLFFGFINIGHSQKNVGTYQDLSAQIIDSARDVDMICIGEHSHGDKKAHTMKTRILDDIVNNVSTAAIFFEAPLVTSVITYLKNESYSEFVWPFWKYESLRTNLETIIEKNQLICLGFDPQETCDFSEFTTFLLSKKYLENGVELAKMDSILAIAIATSKNTKTRRLTLREVELVNEIIDKIKSEIHWPEGISVIERELISLCLENRKYLAREVAFKNTGRRMNFRDSIMALNLAKILKIMKPKIGNEKVILWAANLHIAKKMNQGKWMMERFTKSNNYDIKVLSIGVLPRKLIKKSHKYDFAVLSGHPEWMGEDFYSYTKCD